MRIRLIIPGDLAVLVTRVLVFSFDIAVAAPLLRTIVLCATARYIRRRPDLHGAPARAATDYSTVTDLARLRG